MIRMSLILLLLLSNTCFAQPVYQPAKPFKFAFLSDTHIGSPNGSSEEDLRRSVNDINSMKNEIAFVVITGDITELGTNDELTRAKLIFDSLLVPYYIIPGNHDSGWSESGGLMFSTIFGYDKFSFEYAGIRFLGCPSGPYVRMSDGHIPRDAVNWLDRQLKDVRNGQPVIFLNHYPIDNGLDNWYEVTTRLKDQNTWAILCGHGHANKVMNFEGIPGVMGRSNLRAKAAMGGYNIVDIHNDSIIFSERRPATATLAPWTFVKISLPKGSLKPIERPDYSVNEKYKNVKEKWRYASTSNIISTPAVQADRVMVGNQDGQLICISKKSGKVLWKFSSGGPVFSSPAVSGNSIVFGSADNFIYNLDIRTGKMQWKIKTGAAVLGSPLITNGKIYIGGSDHTFRKIDLLTAEPNWEFKGLDGPVMSTPVAFDHKIIFGAWDRNLYALNDSSGNLEWKWNNGSTVRNYSPASCIPVIHDGVIYVVAPDRYITAIDGSSGLTLWRNNDASVRESIGMSDDGRWIYGKTMQDSVVAYSTGKEKQSVAWAVNCHFGYEHVPSMLIEKDGLVFFGTKNGVVYCIDPKLQKVEWAHKIDNSMVNTVRVLNKHELIVTTMDGKIVYLETD
jgi:outer membrane protein assembly factor BamB/predicted phosphodiesterase